MAYWRARTPRERLIVVVAGALLTIGLCLWLAQSVERSRTVLRTAVPALRAQAELLEQRAAEYQRLRSAPRATASQGDMRSLVQAQTAAAGLTRALTGIEAAEAGRVKIGFGAVLFADWLDMVAALDAQRIYVEACRVEALATPGLVNVTATLVRPNSQ